MNQLNIGQRIKQKREAQKLSLQSVADKLDVNRSSVMRWENGETGRIKLPMLERLAQILHTSPEYLMGYEEDSSSIIGQIPAPESVCLLPVLKTIPLPGDTPDRQDILDYEIAKFKYRQNSLFLSVSGSDMMPRLNEGDRILIHQQNTLENGDLGVFLLDGREYLIRVYEQNESLELHAFNPYYPPLRFDKAEQGRVQIYGKVLESRQQW